MVIYDALIVGAGPAGATCALMLARAGWSVAIAEKAEFPRRKVCGEFVSATALPLLHELGVGADFLARAGPPVDRVGFYAGALALEAPMPPAAGPYVFGRALGREHLDASMLRAAVEAGAVLWQPWRVRALQREADGFHSTLVGKSGSQTVHARVAIDAHGSWERGLLPGRERERESRCSDLLAFKAHFRNCALLPGLMPLIVFPGGYGGMVQTDGGRVTLSCCIRRDRLAASRARYARDAAGGAVLAHVRAHCRGVDEALRRAEPESRWLAAGPIAPGIRMPRTDGVFAVGNAAGEAHPLVAEGIGMAIQSAWLLSRRLIARRAYALTSADRASLARSYAIEWRGLFSRRIYASGVYAQLAVRPTTAAIARDVLARLPGLLTLGAALAGKAQAPAVVRP